MFFLLTIFLSIWPWRSCDRSTTSVTIFLATLLAHLVQPTNNWNTVQGSFRVRRIRPLLKAKREPLSANGIIIFSRCHIPPSTPIRNKILWTAIWIHFYKQDSLLLYPNFLLLEKVSKQVSKFSSSLIGQLLCKRISYLRLNHHTVPCWLWEYEDRQNFLGVWSTGQKS